VVFKAISYSAIYSMPVALFALVIFRAKVSIFAQAGLNLSLPIPGFPWSLGSQACVTTLSFFPLR
jgi:hypothetical protein